MDKEGYLLHCPALRVHAPLIKQRRAEGCADYLCLVGVAGFVDEPELEYRGLTYEVYRALRVFKARKLHYYLSVALPLNKGLGNAEFVYPVADGLERLRSGPVLYALYLGLIERINKAPGLARLRAEGGELVGHHLLYLPHGGLAAVSYFY